MTGYVNFCKTLKKPYLDLPAMCNDSRPGTSVLFSRQNYPTLIDGKKQMKYLSSPLNCDTDRKRPYTQMVIEGQYLFTIRCEKENPGKPSYSFCVGDDFSKDEKLKNLQIATNTIAETIVDEPFLECYQQVGRHLRIATAFKNLTIAFSSIEDLTEELTNYSTPPLNKREKAFITAGLVFLVIFGLCFGFLFRVKRRKHKKPKMPVHLKKLLSIRPSKASMNKISFTSSIGKVDDNSEKVKSMN
ncbi:hypothetical protein SNEBB_002642 [Seison nebaliae]|nr:hypothetical protein SNEBB_002642 [Seison nebaliae]